MSQHFFVKLSPPRPTFAADMTDEEREMMQRHAAYWTGLMQKGIAVVFGPVMDPAGVYGMGVVAAEDEQQLRSLLDADPATRVSHYDFWPMRAVYAAAPRQG